MRTVKLLLPLATLALGGLFIPLSESVRPHASAGPPVAFGPAAEVVETFASNCTTPKVDFNLGETVCAKISGAPLGPPAQRRFQWVNPCNVVEKNTTIVDSDPDFDTFTLPAGPTTAVGACASRGLWRVNDNRISDAGQQASAFFRVHDPADPAADFSMSSNGTPNPVSPGGNITYQFFLINNGPDAAPNAVLTMTVPTNTTYVSATGAAGWTCGAPSGGVVTCTKASVPPASLTAPVQDVFSLVVTVPAGTINNTQFSSVGAVSSDVDRLRGNDDKSTALVSVASATAGPALSAAGGTIASESCGVANNVIDPGETVTVSFCVTNNGNQATTAALTGTLRATQEVATAFGPVNFGVIAVGGTQCRNFTYTATNAECSTLSAPTIDLQDGANNRGTVVYTPSFGQTFIMGQSNGSNGFTCCATAAPTVTAGQVLISEYRFRGAGGASDEFVELYNNTNAALDISGHTLHALTATGAQNLRFTVPGALGSGTTMIPARGHYLITGSAYSLAAVAASNGALSTGIVDGSSIGFFGGATPTAGTRIDSAGFDNRDALFFEGTPVTPSGAGTGGITVNGEYSFLRRLNSGGTPQDTGNNDADFVFVSTTGGTFSTRVSILGAPGPESLTSPVNRSNAIKASLLDPPAGSSAAPNRVRTLRASCPSCDNTKSNLGTLEIRRKFTNNTGAPLTRLRFRIVDITTLNNRLVSQADLRALNATGNFLVTTSGGNVTVESLTLEAPSDAVTNGGALNSTLAAGTITAGTPLANGASINVNFLLGVQLAGDFRFFVIVEAAPGGPPFGPVKLGPAVGGGSSKALNGSSTKLPRTN